MQFIFIGQQLEQQHQKSWQEQVDLPVHEASRALSQVTTRARPRTMESKDPV